MSTDEFNKVSEERQKQLHQLIESTLMGVLAALYESNIVKRVNMGKVLTLFGLDEPDLQDTWVNFDDPEFLVGYSKYKIKQALKYKVKKQKKDVSDKLEKYFDDPNRTIH